MSQKQFNILIVDDDEFMRKTVVMLIKNLNHNLIVASSGLEALEIVKTQPVDLIISDIQMPDGNGIFLLEEIRRINPDIPVVHLMTGHTSYSEQEMIGKGAAGVLIKPFTRAKLLEIINSALEKVTSHAL